MTVIRRAFVLTPSHCIMSPVPSNTVHQPQTTADGATVPPPPQAEHALSGGVQALPDEALDFAARVSEDHIDNDRRTNRRLTICFGCHADVQPCP